MKEIVNTWNGIPDKSKTSGFHWLKTLYSKNTDEVIVYWESKTREWSCSGYHIPPDVINKSFTYLCPVVPRKESIIHRKMVYFFAGWTSTLPEWSDKHPEETFKFVEREAINSFEEDERNFVA